MAGSSSRDFEEVSCDSFDCIGDCVSSGVLWEIMVSEQKVKLVIA